MKIFAIRDGWDKTNKDIAYLVYYEYDKTFFIELPDDADYRQAPIFLDSFIKRNEKTINSFYSFLWVKQRIIPIDRQNIGDILRNGGLKEYDEYQMLIMAMGRCAQDECYLVPLTFPDLPIEIKKRFERKVEDVLPLEDYSVLVFFKDGKTKKCDLKDYFEKTQPFGILLKHKEYFSSVQLLPGGYGLSWDINMTIMYNKLYEMGTDIPLSLSDFKNFVMQRVVNTSEATELLHCTRQNLVDLTKRKKLQPLKASPKNTLYLKSDLLKRNW